MIEKELHKVLQLVVGPSGVRALPLAAGTNEGGHYFCYIFPPNISCAGKRTYPARFVTTVIQNHRRGCRIVSNFCMGP